MIVTPVDQQIRQMKAVRIQKSYYDNIIDHAVHPHNMNFIMGLLLYH